MKTTLRRLQQLELRYSESLAASDGSGALERILEKINCMNDPQRAYPNNLEVSKPTVAELRRRIQEAVSRSRSTTAK